MAPILSSPYKSVSRQRSPSPLPPPLPAKPIDLNSSTRSTDKDSGAKITKRAFLCDVVVTSEGDATNTLLQHLGSPLPPLSTLSAASSSLPQRPQHALRSSRIAGSDEESDVSSNGWTVEKQTDMSKRLASLIEELVRTERSYLSRIQALKKNYADPLRSFARQEYSKIIPMYEAKTLFTNIDAIVPASQTFLADLESMLAAGSSERSIGEVCLKHLKIVRTFDPYRAYLAKQDESQRMFQDVLKKFPSFGSYIERTKYQTVGIGNIGLRELLMEPVQRIPRYTLLWQTMIKSMPPMSSERAKLVEAVQIASQIAKCEPDPQTVRATVMYCLERNVEGFPANLFSSNRDFIDAIDVDDIPADYPTQPSPTSRTHSRPMSVTSTSTSASTPSLSSMVSTTSSAPFPASPHGFGPINHQSIPPLHCTLFLFDDKLMIVKRQSSSVSGRKLTGLDDVHGLVKSGGGVAVLEKTATRKDKLSYKGVVNVLDVIAADTGNGDFQLFLEKPPSDQGERWSSRAFRSYSTVQPPYGNNIDPVANRRDKLRFVQNLWSVQARARAKIQAKSESRGVPRVLVAEEEYGLDRAGEPFGRARCFWNVWNRSDWQAYSSKAKVAVLVDEDDSASDIAVAENGPYMTVRLQPLAGGLCRFSYATEVNSSESGRLIELAEVGEEIATTIHRHRIFKFRTSAGSCPTTPSSTGHRLRPSMLNLDAISRNLFGHGSLSAKSQLGTSEGTDFDLRSRPYSSRALTLDSGSPSRSDYGEGRTRAAPASPSRHASDTASPRGLYAVTSSPVGRSENDLEARLNLARRNSRSMAAIGVTRESVPSRRDKARQEEQDSLTPTPISSIAMAEPAPIMPLGSKDIIDLTADDSRSHIPVTTSGLIQDSSSTRSESVSMVKSQISRWNTTSRSPDLATSLPERGAHPLPQPPSLPSTTSSGLIGSGPVSPRPQGPRSPITRTPTLGGAASSSHVRLRIVSGNGRRVSVGRETMPLKGADENASPPVPSIALPAHKRQHSSEQLSPRKRSPTRSPLQPRTVESLEDNHTPKPRQGEKRSTARRISGQTHVRRSSASLSASRRTSNGSAGHAFELAAEDVFSATPDKAGTTDPHRRLLDSKATVKKLKVEVQNLRRQLSRDSGHRPSFSNSSLPRSPHRRNINRLVDQSLDDLGNTTRSAQNGKLELDSVLLDESARGLVAMVDKLDSALQACIADFHEASDRVAQLETETLHLKTKVQQLGSQMLQSRETDGLLRQQLAETQIEVDVIYEAFNTELDGLFNDAQLPETQAFESLQQDLQLTKAKRNDLALENLKLKRELQEANLKREQYAKVLRENGLLQ